MNEQQRYNTLTYIILPYDKIYRIRIYLLHFLNCIFDPNEFIVFILCCTYTSRGKDNDSIVTVCKKRDYLCIGRD